MTGRAIVLRDAAVLLAFALVFRAAAFGDPNVHLDEAFYFLVGQAMHHGAVPYIDIWDRKPFGLFAIYWAIAGISKHVLAYQLVATAFAAATALTLAQIARRWVGGWTPAMAGIAYLASLHPLLGMGGQSPVFYNLPIAAAALQLVGGWTGSDTADFRGRYLGAMALCGLALTIKQTTLFEGVYFGLAGLWWLGRKGLAPVPLAATALAAMAIAALPTLLIGGWYFAHGWGAEWWNAMFTSNLRRQGVGLPAVLHNIYAISRLLAVFVGTVLIGIVMQRTAPAFRAWRGFMFSWLAAALIGFAAMPNYFAHYALPLIVPMTPIAAIALAQRVIGPVLLAATVVVSAILGRSFDFAHHRASLAGFNAMANVIEAHRTDGSLALFHGPLLLYPATHSHPLSPLVFPEHLINRLETGVSQFDTRGEVHRIIARRPSVVVMPEVLDLPAADGRIEEIRGYLAASCREVWRGKSYEPRDISKIDIVYACAR